MYLLGSFSVPRPPTARIGGSRSLLRTSTGAEERKLTSGMVEVVEDDSSMQAVIDAKTHPSIRERRQGISQQRRSLPQDSSRENRLG